MQLRVAVFINVTDRDMRCGIAQPVFIKENSCTLDYNVTYKDIVTSFNQLKFLRRYYNAER